MTSNIAPPRTSSLSRIGLPLTILSALILVGTLGYWVYANSGGVTVNDAGLKSTLTALVIASAVAGVLGLLATGLNVPALRQPRLVSGVATAVSGATLIVAALFLFVTVIPHAQVATFAQTVVDNCQTPINNITADITAASAAAKKTQSTDSDFVTAMQQQAVIFGADSTKATTDAATVKGMTPISSKYQGVLDDCAGQFMSDANFLTGAHGITLPSTLPAPFGGQQLSAQSLLQDSAALVTGTFPGVSTKYPASIVSQIVTGVLDQAVKTCDDVCTRLTAEGNQLKTDAYTPFKPQS